MQAITASSLSLLAGIEKSDGRPTKGVHFGHFANKGIATILIPPHTANDFNDLLNIEVETTILGRMLQRACFHVYSWAVKIFQSGGAV